MKFPCPNYKVFSEEKHQTPILQAQNSQFREKLQKGISEQEGNKTTVGKKKQEGEVGSQRVSRKSRRKRKQRNPNFDYKFNEESSNSLEIRQRRWPNFKNKTKQNKSSQIKKSTVNSSIYLSTILCPNQYFKTH